MHNDFLKIFIDMKSSQNIAHTFPRLNVNPRILICKSSFSFFYIIVCCKISNLIDIIIQDDVSGCVICTLNKFEYLDKEESHKNFTKEVILSI